jgi:hypothetical protein
VDAETVVSRLARLGMYIATVVVPATAVGALVSYLAR